MIIGPTGSSEHEPRAQTPALFRRLTEVAAHDPARPAAIHNESRLTYRELVSRAGEFCERLRLGGVQPREGVAVILGNGAQFLVAAFGTWKRGAVLYPLNPLLQELEFEKYLAGTNVRAIVTNSKYAGVAQALQARLSNICLLWLLDANDEKAYQVRSRTAMPIPATTAATGAVLQWPATTLYSTGSTGYPKRVTRTHEQLLGEFLCVGKRLGISRDDRILGTTPFFHTYGLTNSVLLATLSGATLYPVDGFFARNIAKLIEREQISIFAGVPFMFQLLAELKEGYSFASLRCALTAGAQFPEPTAHAFKNAYRVEVRQQYGTTETGAICIGFGPTDSFEPNCIGPPLEGVTLQIVDDSGATLATGEAGRIAVVSDYAASHYDNDAGNSESHFDARMFFPGDLGRMTAAGKLVLCGRNRGFINVGGNKVDPKEVESVLLELAGLKEAVVFGAPDGAAGEKIKAVLVTSAGVTKAEIRAHLITRLAEFKHPRVIEFRDELPKSPLGKVLRKYLMEENAATKLRK